MKKLIYIIYYILILIFSTISIYLLFNATIIPNNIIHLIILFYVLCLILLLILLTRKRKIFRILGILLSMLLVIANTGMIYLYNKTNSFFDKITNVKYEITNYSVIVTKEFGINTLEHIKNIGMFHNEMDENYKDAIVELDDKQKIDQKEYDNILTLVNDLINIRHTCNTGLLEMYLFFSVFISSSRSQPSGQSHDQ